MKTFFQKHNRILITLGSGGLILVGTLIAIQFAKGYRPSTESTTFLAGTGLLSATSNPTNAQVMIDGELQNKVTDDSFNLKPGEYQVSISKIGFTTWQKRLNIEKELVTSTDAHLFRSVPSLTPLTFSGAENITPSPDGQKIAFSIASPSAELKDGLYILDLNDRPALFSRGARLIAENPGALDFKDAAILWSPDSQEVLVHFGESNYLLDPNKSVRRQELVEASADIQFILTNWEQEMTRREKQLFSSLPEEMFSILTQKAKNVYFSPNGEKVIYTALEALVIPENLVPPLPASSTQAEDRTISAGSVYVYDLKEDKNFLLFQQPAEEPAAEFSKIKLVTDLSEESLFTQDATQAATLRLQDSETLEQTIQNFRTYYSSSPFTDYQWFPTSQHILVSQNGSISIIEYDSTNFITLFSGQHEDGFVYPWPNGEKLIILTNLTQNPDLPPNLYAINLK